MENHEDSSHTRVSRREKKKLDWGLKCRYFVFHSVIWEITSVRRYPRKQGHWLNPFLLLSVKDGENEIWLVSPLATNGAREVKRLENHLKIVGHVNHGKKMFHILHHFVYTLLCFFARKRELKNETIFIALRDHKSLT